MSLEPLPAEVLGLLAAVAERLGGAGAVLLAQANDARVTKYSATFICMVVSQSVPAGTWPDGPLALSPTVVDRDEAPTGSILIWVKGGRLSSVEQPWYTDVAPTDWPQPASLRWD